MTQGIIKPTEDRRVFIDIYGRTLIKTDGVWYIQNNIEHCAEEAPEYLQKWYNSFAKLLGYED
jgi:hypothetical protein